MTDLTERQKVIAKMAAVLLAGQRDPHPSALPASVKIATQIVEEVERSVKTTVSFPVEPPVPPIHILDLPAPTFAKVVNAFKHLPPRPDGYVRIEGIMICRAEGT